MTWISHVSNGRSVSNFWDFGIDGKRMRVNSVCDRCDGVATMGVRSRCYRVSRMCSVSTWAFGNSVTRMRVSSYRYYWSSDGYWSMIVRNVCRGCDWYWSMIVRNNWRCSSNHWGCVDIRGYWWNMIDSSTMSIISSNVTCMIISCIIRTLVNCSWISSFNYLRLTWTTSEMSINVSLMRIHRDYWSWNRNATVISIVRLMSYRSMVVITIRTGYCRRDNY